MKEREIRTAKMIIQILNLFGIILFTIKFFDDMIVIRFSIYRSNAGNNVA